MAAGKSPATLTGTINNSDDVKQEAVASTTAKEGDTAEEPKEKDPELDESDLEKLKTAKTVPYQRFKEVNDKFRTLEKELANRKYSDTDLKRAIEDAELRIEARLKKQREEEEAYTGLDDSERSQMELKAKIEQLHGELSELKGRHTDAELKSRIKELRTNYPDADDLAVLGWLKAQPGLDVEELMAHSQKVNVERVENRLRQLIEEKKHKAKTVLPTKPGGIRLKPEQKAKTIREATQKFLQMFGE